MGRMLAELQLISIDLKDSTDSLRQSMKLYEKLGDTAAKMECYQVALNNYSSLVCSWHVFYLLFMRILIILKWVY